MFWEEVGDDVWSFVRGCFAHGQFVAPIFDSQMVLIPKNHNPISFKDFRPFSLCNVLYKFVTKVLVNQLRPFLSELVSPLQSNFIPGRSTIDNDVLLQEIVHQEEEVILFLNLILRRLMIEWTGIF